MISERQTVGIFDFNNSELNRNFKNISVPSESTIVCLRPWKLLSREPVPLFMQSFVYTLYSDLQICKYNASRASFGGPPPPIPLRERGHAPHLIIHKSVITVTARFWNPSSLCRRCSLFLFVPYKCTVYILQHIMYNCLCRQIFTIYIYT
jgi:hypothetical protein